MVFEWKVAARDIVTSLGLLASVAACSGPAADGDPDFQGPQPFGGNPVGGSPSVGGSGATGVGNGMTGRGANLGNSGENVGNPPIANGNSGGTGNSTGAGNAGSGNVNGAGGGSGAGGSASAAQGGSASMPPANGGAGGTDPGNVGGTGGTQTPPVEEPPEPLPGGFYLIDDFEGSRDPGWTESEVGGGAGTFTLDASQGANGSSGSIRIDANNQFHTMLQFALPQAVRTENEVFGRVYLRLAENPSGNQHYIWVEVGTTANDGHEMRLGHNVGRLQSNHWLNGEQDIRDRNRFLVADTWYCLEFRMSNNPDQLQVWLDEQETALSTNNYTAGANADGNTNPVADFIPDLQAFRIGWELQNGTVWFDDVALANSRIGCE